ncbi:MAG: hypothetical protein AAGD23_05300 [Pseudomonadota bacterium]
MQTNTPFSAPDMTTGISMPGRTAFSPDRSWVEEDRAQSMMILRACAIWIVAIFGAVLVTLVMTAGAYAATSTQVIPGDTGLAAKAIVGFAMVAAASLTIYMLRDTAQRVPARKRRRSSRPG